MHKAWFRPVQRACKHGLTRRSCLPQPAGTHLASLGFLSTTCCYSGSDCSRPPGVVGNLKAHDICRYGRSEAETVERFGVRAKTGSCCRLVNAGSKDPELWRRDVCSARLAKKAVEVQKGSCGRRFWKECLQILERDLEQGGLSKCFQ